MNFYEALRIVEDTWSDFGPPIETPPAPLPQRAMKTRLGPGNLETLPIRDFLLNIKIGTEAGVGESQNFDKGWKEATKGRRSVRLLKNASAKEVGGMLLVPNEIYSPDMNKVDTFNFYNGWIIHNRSDLFVRLDKQVTDDEIGGWMIVPNDVYLQWQMQRVNSRW